MDQPRDDRTRRYPSRKTHAEPWRHIEADDRRHSRPAPRDADKIHKRVHVPWHLDISHGDLQKIIAGFRPRDMDDKWAAVTKGPDEQGIFTVIMQRSWTGNLVLALKVRTELNYRGKVRGDRPVQTTEILFESQHFGDLLDQTPEQEAKELVRWLCKGLLDVKLPSKALP
ncbi:hypothetical protein S40285_04057 [Stachybotrys chlorohalonatus IBT 40285]|uniref:Uncharacterized protein n=1 Tax=Stachybotrys chlorohalonatus (strain IBT 40285) TaxID=1283841 RepID=A0A084R0B5_STAC4|nr:hypothetical protein S40285_04057 [Stachybotrys chlorohalonata IBT 40285]